MSINFNKSYKFAFKSSIYISLFVIASLLIYNHFVQHINVIILLAFPITLFVFSFFLIQYRVEVFIYKRIKKLYDEDYASHIAPDTQKETRELILGLIGVFKQAWDTSPDTVKESIKSQFKKMALLVIPILETENIINPPKKK